MTLVELDGFVLADAGPDMLEKQIVVDYGRCACLIAPLTLAAVST